MSKKEMLEWFKLGVCTDCGAEDDEDCVCWMAKEQEEED